MSDPERVLVLAVLVLATVGSASALHAQSEPEPLTDSQVKDLATERSFFDNKDNQRLGNCSDAAWELMRQAIEASSRLLFMPYSGLDADAVVKDLNTVEGCRKSTSEKEERTWNLIVTFIRAGNAQSASIFLDEYVILQGIYGYAQTAQDEILASAWQANYEHLKHNYNDLKDRYNALVNHLATEHLPRNFERPSPLHCAAETQRVGIYTTTTLDCR